MSLVSHLFPKPSVFSNISLLCHGHRLGLVRRRSTLLIRRHPPASFTSLPSPLPAHSRHGRRKLSMDSASPEVSASVDSVAEGLKNQSLNNDDRVDGGSSINHATKKKLEDLNWDNSFVRELPGDPRTDIIPREVLFLCFELWIFANVNNCLEIGTWSGNVICISWKCGRWRE